MSSWFSEACGLAGLDVLKISNSLKKSKSVLVDSNIDPGFRVPLLTIPRIYGS